MLEINVPNPFFSWEISLSLLRIYACSTVHVYGEVERNSCHLSPRLANSSFKAGFTLHSPPPMFDMYIRNAPHAHVKCFHRGPLVRWWSRACPFTFCLTSIHQYTAKHKVWNSIVDYTFYLAFHDVSIQQMPL